MKVCDAMTLDVQLCTPEDTLKVQPKRGHGPGGRYKGRYPSQTLSEWARRIRSWKKQGCDIFVYFDNDQKSAAPADARELERILNQP